jgi:hypothetical protein
MPEGANVQSIELLRELQGVLWKFREACVGSLDDVESELRRTVIWLETEQDTYWKAQIRIRHEALERAKEALRSKKIFKDASGRPQSVVEEQKALKIAMQRMAEAEEKLSNVRKWVRALQKEIELYKGSVGRLSHSVESLVPAAVHQLDRMMVSLEAYVNLEMSDQNSAAEASQSVGSNFANRGEALAHAISALPTPPTVEQRQGAASLDSINVPCPTIAPEFIDAIGRTDSPPADMQQTLVCSLASAQNPDSFTIMRLPSAAPDDSGWVLISGNSDDQSWGKVPLQRMATDGDEMKKWQLILRLPVGFSVNVNKGAVVHMTNESP